MLTAPRGSSSHRVLVRAVAMVTSVAVVLAGVEQPAFAGPRTRGAPATAAQPKPAPGRLQAVRYVEPPNQAAAAALTAPPKVRWPQAGSVDLDLGGTPRRTAVGGMPVAVTAASRAVAGTAGSTAAGRVRVRVLDKSGSTRTGASGPVLVVGAPDAEVAGPVRVSIDYRDFADAFGGDYGARLRFVALPACALTTPQVAGCQRGTPVVSHNDSAARTLSATVDLSAGAAVLAAEGDDTSSQGSYEATKLAPSSKWDVSLASGGFAWTYPLRSPPTPGGLVPEVTLSYQSQAVDTRTSATNNQGSWIGEGFTYEPGYIERRYRPCSDDGHENYGDQCWAFQNASIALGGRSGDLVKVNDNLWKLTSDDGTRIERLTGATNGDNDGEYWRAITTDGTEYYFGLNRLPGWNTGREETGATWTVPISGDDPNEPCHASSGWEDSFCDQGWRWNLDYVKDVHGNVIAYYYGKEINAYAKTADTDVNGASYVRGGYLKRIDYGQADGAVYSAPAPARIRFDTAERCLSTDTISCAESALTADTANAWPDVPFDRNCDVGTHCKITQGAASFWTRKRLTAITTEIRGADAWTPVEEWRLTHTFTDNGDGSKTLWLDQIDHAGLDGTRTPMPPVKLVGGQLPNRIDTDTDMLAPLNRYRLNAVITDSGAQIRVNYASADCGPGNVPTEGNSTRRCFPVKWSPHDGDDITDWFHKYVVESVIQVDQTGGSPDMVTTYQYESQGFGDKDPLVGGAWRKTAPDGITKDEDRTWSEWRGYPKVIVRTGSMQTLTGRVDHYFFRGMDGDAAPGGGTRSVKVTDDAGAEYVDADELAGTELETITYNGAEVTSRKISRPELWVTHTQTESWGTRKATMVKVGVERVLTPLAPAEQDAPVWREARTNTSYNHTTGQTTAIEDLGDIGTPDDDTCQRTEYADNPARNMIKYPRLTETFSVRCDVVPDRATRLLSSERLSFDNQDYGAAPTKGDVTRRETLERDDGTTTNYLTTTMVVDRFGRQTRLVDPAGGVTTTAYELTNGLSTKTTVTNQMGHSTVTETSPTYGQTIRSADANLRKTDLAYDGLGRLTAVWLPDRPKDQGFSPNSRYSYLVRADKPSVVTTEKVRNDGGYAATHQILDSLLRVRQTQSQGPGGTWLLGDTTFLPTGQVDTATGPYVATGQAGDGLLVVPDGTVNSAKQYRYDGAGRIVAEIFTVAGDERWRTTTSYNGERTTTLPPQGGTPRTTTVDARGHTTELIEYCNSSLSGPNTITRYTYGANGKIETITDPIGAVWNYRYDQRGNLVESDDPDAGTSHFTYDALNRMTSEEDSRHQVISSVYDKIGRVTARWAGQPGTGTKLATWTYDTYYKGELAGSARLVGSAVYYTTVPQRDARYRPLKTTYIIPKDAGVALAGTYDVTTSYNPDGTVRGVGYPAAGGLPAENVVTTYDDLQRPLALTGLTPYVVNDDNNKTRYGALGELLQLTLWNGTGAKAWQTFEYERGTGRLTRSRLDRQNAPAVDVDAHYRYDAAGNVLAIADTPQGSEVDTQCFSYDGYRRMTEAWSSTVTDPATCDGGAAATGVGGTDPYHQTWSFDDVGDRTSQTDLATSGAATTSDYRYAAADGDQPHTLASVVRDDVTQAAYTYNEHGDMVTRETAAGTETFAWDAEGNLATYSAAGKDTSLVYDVDGNRLVQKAPGVTTLYLGATELRLNTVTGQVTATRYYSFGDTVVAVRTPDRVSYLISDHHGTSTCTVDASTGAITRRRMTPYGSVRGEAPSWWPDDKGFLGGTQDASGMVHLGAREYDPTTGRFISVDPELNNDTPQQLNGYSYAANNPVTLSDPGGTDPIGGAIARAVRAALQAMLQLLRDPGGRFGLAPAAPATCSSATPEYCQRSGGNRMRTENLFAQWTAAEQAGCPEGMDICVTTEYFRDGDPFTEDVKKLVTIDAARAQIEAAIANGKSYDTAHFHMSRMTPEERKMAALNNAIGIATGGEKGMQWALSFLGSYDLTWKVVGADANGNPVVEYNLTNASTKASARPNKGKVGQYSQGDNESAGDGHDAVSGEHYTRQSVRWRESYVGGSAPMANATRQTTPLCMGCRSRRVRYNSPSDKDPLVSGLEYKAIEWGLKKGLPN